MRAHSINAGITFLIIFFLSFYQQVCSAQEYVKLSVFEERNYNDPSLRLFEESLKGKRIVFLGDIIHGEANVDSARAYLIRYLIDKHNFNTIAFESGFYDLILADKNLRTGADVRHLLGESIYNVWSGSSLQPLVDVISDNRNGIHLIGFDPKSSGKAASDLDLDLGSFLTKGHAQFDTAYLVRLKNIADDLSLQTIDDLDENQFDETLGKIRSYLDSMSSEIKKTTEFSIWQQVLLTMSGRYHMVKAGIKTDSSFRATNANLRDSLMAANLEFYLKLYPKMKAICWGASAHFAHRLNSLDNQELKGFKSMGSYFGSEALSVGAMGVSGEFGTGSIRKMPALPESSVERKIMILSAGQSVLFKMSALKFAMPLSSSALVEAEPIRGDWTTAFDYVMCFPKIYPKSTLFSPAQKQKDQAQQTAVRTGSLNISSNTDFVLLKSKIRIHGKIIDAKKEPVPFTTLLVQGSDLGAIADARGDFDLKIPFKGLDTIIVSNVAFQTRNISVSEFIRTGSSVIELSDANNQLKEITVHAGKLDAAGILNEAISKIELNYWQGPYSMEILHHGYKIDSLNSSMTTIDWNAKMFVPKGYQSVSTESGFAIEEARQEIRDRNGSSYAPYATDVSDFYGINLFDPVRYRINSILNKDNNSAFHLELVGIVDTKQGELFKIEFVCKRISGKTAIFDVRRAQHYKGAVYINSADYAIVKMDSEVVWDLEAFPKLKTKNRDKDLKTLISRQTTEYEKQDGYYVLVKNTRYQNFTDYGIREYYYYGYRRENQTLFKSGFELSVQNYHPEFWSHVTFPPGLK